MSRRKITPSLYVALSLLLWALALGPGGVGLARSEGARSSSEFDDFPLWKDVPGRTFAKLGEGKLPNGTRWAGYASRVGSGKRGRENPCVTVSSITAFGAYSPAHECGPLAPVREGWPPVTAMFTISDSDRGQEAGETFMAMSFKTSIVSILITLEKGETIRRRTHLLNRYQRRKTHLPPLRYVALGLERAICIANLVGYNAAGEVAFEAPFKECEPNPPAS